MAENTTLKHHDQARVVRHFPRPPTNVIGSLAKAYTGFVLDRLGKNGSMHYDIKPLSSGMRFCGPAVTCLGPDLSVRRMAINLAEPGDVLVVAAGGVREYACFGDGTARRMLLKGLNAAIIDGSTRDAAALRSLPFATFCRGATARNYHYPMSAGYGAINVPVICGGVLVRPGDIVMGDDDGVIVIHAEDATAVADSIERAVTNEAEARASMKSYEPFDVNDELTRLGYRFE